jgi:hypothetical protein
MQLGSVVGAIFRLFNFIHQYQVILSLFNQIFYYYYYYYYYYSLVDTTNFWMVRPVTCHLQNKERLLGTETEPLMPKSLVCFLGGKKKKKQNREKKKCAYLALVVVSPLQ